MDMLVPPYVVYAINKYRSYLNICLLQFLCFIEIRDTITNGKSEQPPQQKLEMNSFYTMMMETTFNPSDRWNIYDENKTTLGVLNRWKNLYSLRFYL
jgi:hypothetical protein